MFLVLVLGSPVNRWMLARCSTRLGRVVFALPLLVNVGRQAAWYFVVSLWR